MWVTITLFHIQAAAVVREASMGRPLPRVLAAGVGSSIYSMEIWASSRCGTRSAMSSAFVRMQSATRFAW